jgi:hypothetical protein
VNWRQRRKSRSGSGFRDFDTTDVCPRDRSGAGLHEGVAGQKWRTREARARLPERARV